MFVQQRKLATPLGIWAGLFISQSLLFATAAFGETTVLKATEHFSALDSGAAPYYAEPARGSLAINAANESHRGVFARAESTFTGSSGFYDVTLIGLAELDGEADYRFFVNERLIGIEKNPITSVDYMPIAHAFSNVEILNGDVLAVESLANSNDKIPEGNAFAFARGRWTELRITPQGETDVQPDKVSLTSNASTLTDQLAIDESVELNFAAINNDEAGTTATNVRMVIDLPSELSVPELGNCSEKTSTHPGSNIITCPIMQLAPGDAASGSIVLVAESPADTALVSATVIAAQTEMNGVDNRAEATFKITTTSVANESNSESSSVSSGTEQTGSDSGSNTTTESSSQTDADASSANPSETTPTENSTDNSSVAVNENSAGNTSDNSETVQDSSQIGETSSASTTGESSTPTEGLDTQNQPAEQADDSLKTGTSSESTESGGSSSSGAIGLSAGLALVAFLILTIRRRIAQ